MKGGMGRPRMEVEMGVVPKVPNHGNAKSRLHAYAGSWLRWRAAGMVPWTKVTGSHSPDFETILSRTFNPFQGL